MAGRRVSFDIYATDNVTRVLGKMSEQTREFKTRLDRLAAKATSFKIAADDRAAKSKLFSVQAQLARIDKTIASPKLDVAGLAKSEADLAKLDAELDSIGRKRETAVVDVRSTPESRRLFGLLSTGIGLSPMLSPLLGSAAGGLGGLATAFSGAAAGAGTFGILAGTELAEVAKDLDKAHGKWQKLPADERAVGREILNLKAIWSDAQDAIKPVILADLGKAADLARRGLRDLQPIAQQGGKAIGDLADRASKALGQPFWRDFFTKFLAGRARRDIDSFGTDLGNVAGGFAGLLEAFAPIADGIERHLERMTGDFRHWGQTLGQSKGFASFTDYARKYGPRVVSLLGNLARVGGNLLAALAPLGGTLLTAAGGFTKFLAALPPNELLAVAGGIGLVAGALGSPTGFVAAAAAAVAIIDRNYGPQLAAKLAGPFRAVRGAISDAGSAISDFTTGMFHGVQPKGRVVSVSDIVRVQTGAPRTAAGMAGGAFHSLIGSIGKTFTSGLGHLDTGKLGSALGKSLRNAIGWLGQHVASITSAFIRAIGRVDWFEIGVQVGKQAVPFIVGLVGNLFDPGTIYRSIRKHPMQWTEALGAFLVVGRAGGAIAKVLDKLPILRWFSPLFRGLESITRPVNSAIGKVIRAIGRGFVTGLGKEFPRTAEWISQHVQGGISTALTRTVGAIRRAAAKVGNGILGGISSTTEALGRLVGRVIHLITWPFRTSGSWLVRAGRDLLGGFSRGITDRAPAVWHWLSGVDGHVTQFFRNAGGWLYGRGRDLLGGFFHGIADRLSAVGGWYKWIKAHTFDPIVHAIKSLFGIASPSRVMHALGSSVMEGFVKGMLLHDPVAVAKKLVGSIPGLLGNIGGDIGGVFTHTGGFLKNVKGGGNSPLAAQATAYNMVKALGWDVGQFHALQALWNGESGWRYNARNASSGAYGIPQALPASKMASAGADWLTNAATQIRWGLAYIKSRYGDPATAYRMWLNRSPHWYGSGLQGGVFRQPTLIGVGERGPERVDVTPIGHAGRDAIDYDKLGRAVASAMLGARIGFARDAKGDLRAYVQELIGANESFNARGRRTR